MRVLVVDDEPNVSEFFVDSLTELGHLPHVVSSGEAALARLATDRPDAMILDLDLPGGMSGLDFLQLRPIKECGVPIVATSGVATESQARECIRLGAFDFVAKPVSLDRLREVLMYVEDHAVAVRADGLRERRRAARVAVALPVRVIEDSGVEWAGTSVDISPFGVKVRAPSASTAGSTVRISFALPDDGPPVLARALVVRHVDGYAFYFVNLADDDFRRLTAFVQRLLVP